MNTALNSKRKTITIETILPLYNNTIWGHVYKISEDVRKPEVLTYRAGFCVHALHVRGVGCNTSRAHLEITTPNKNTNTPTETSTTATETATTTAGRATDDHYRLIRAANRGGLTFPSPPTVSIVTLVYCVVEALLKPLVNTYLPGGSHRTVAVLLSEHAVKRYNTDKALMDECGVCGTQKRALVERLITVATNCHLSAYVRQRKEQAKKAPNKANRKAKTVQAAALAASEAAAGAGVPATVAGSMPSTKPAKKKKESKTEEKGGEGRKKGKKGENKTTTAEPPTVEWEMEGNDDELVAALEAAEAEYDWMVEAYLEEAEL
eukprot:comp24332_c0_seq1/m.46025 comp24332_c0_seq1/g.46025  ORF comp24332_c0_seq1/g.46025 comp24332_c0_seq1/m.46025 type:complete len:321 (-) comp24332_c0_seq1:347-1309(-)